MAQNFTNKLQVKLRRKEAIKDSTRALLGFIFGLIIMVFVVNIFIVNDFDFNNMRRGTAAIIAGNNPWAPETRLEHFYNPPFSVLFLWPLIFSSPKLMIALGGAFLFTIIFYQKTWVGLAWFATNTFLWIIANGGIDMFIIGAGLLCLFAGDKLYQKNIGVLLRIIGYGFLMVKPQGSIFIVVIYILIKRDWKGLLVSMIVYGIFFWRYYPDWFQVLITNPPQAQNDATHSLWGKFGPLVSILIAVWVIATRKWEYWQLGGALAGILAPYGMPGIPIFLTLTAVQNLAAIPIYVIFSGGMAALTWVSPPPEIEFYKYTSPFMAIYHLSMLSLALILACYSSRFYDKGFDLIKDGSGYIQRILSIIDRKIKRTESS